MGFWTQPVFNLTYSEYDYTNRQLDILKEREKKGESIDEDLLKRLTLDNIWYEHKLIDICIKHVSLAQLSLII